MGVVSDLTCEDGGDSPRFNFQIVDGLEQIEREQDSMFDTLYNQLRQRVNAIEQQILGLQGRAIRPTAGRLQNILPSITGLQNRVNQFMQARGEQPIYITPDYPVDVLEPLQAQPQSQEPGLTPLQSQLESSTMPLSGTQQLASSPETQTGSTQQILPLSTPQQDQFGVTSDVQSSPQTNVSQASSQDGRSSMGQDQVSSLPNAMGDTNTPPLAGPLAMPPLLDETSPASTRETTEAAAANPIIACCNQIVTLVNQMKLTIENQNQVILMLQSLIPPQQTISPVQPPALVDRSGIPPNVMLDRRNVEGEGKDLIDCNEVRPDPIPFSYCDIIDLNKLVDAQIFAANNKDIDKRAIMIDLLTLGRIGELEPSLGEG